MKENEWYQQTIDRLKRQLKLAINDINNVLGHMNENNASRDEDCSMFCKHNGVNCFEPYDDNIYKCRNFKWRYIDIIPEAEEWRLKK